MNNVKTERSLWERVISLFLVVIMMFTSMPGLEWLVLAEGENESSFKIAIEWEDDDSFDKGEQTFDTGEAKYTFTNSKDNFTYYSAGETNDVRMKVTYSNKVTSRAYKPGELIITIPGMKDAVRSGNSYIASSVAADKEGTETKSYNWSYSYTEESDTYTFTNNFAIEDKSVFEGTFEIVWSIAPRDSIHKFEKDFQAEMFIAGNDEYNSETASSKPIHYRQLRQRDTYELQIGVSEINGIKKNDALENIRVLYNLTCKDNYKARDVKTEERFELWFPDNAKVNHYGLTKTDDTFKFDLNETDGKRLYRKYTFVEDIKDNTEQPFMDKITVIYPPEYDGRTVNVYGDVYGTYFEEEDEQLLDDTSCPTIIKNYNYQDMPGDVYDVFKTSYGMDKLTLDEKQYKNGAINKNHLKNGGGEYYSDLKISLNFTDHEEEKGYISQDLEFIDDFLDVQTIDINNPIHQLAEDEYHFTKIRIPPKSEILDSAGKPIQGDYKIEIKGRPRGTDNDGFNVFTESLCGTLTLSDNEQIVNINRADIVAIDVIFEGVHEDIGLLYNPDMAQTMVRCYYEFSMKPETIEKIANGQNLLNNMLFKLYNNDAEGNRTWVNDNFGEKEYDKNDKNLSRDMDVYKHYVDREKGETPIIEIPNTFTSKSASLKEEVSDKNTQHFSGGFNVSFTPGVGAYTDVFSMYISIPDGLHLEKEYSTPDALLQHLKFENSYGLSSAEIASKVKIEIVGNKISLHFDFTGSNLGAGNINVSDIPMYVNKDELKKQSYRYELQGVIMMDTDPLPNYPGMKTQNGEWVSNHKDENDIDGDGNKKEYYGLSTFARYYTPSVETLVSLKKYVKTPLTNDEVSPDDTDTPPQTYVGDVYSYILKAELIAEKGENNGKANHIIFADVIEPTEIDPNSEWQGTFVDIDYENAWSNLHYKSDPKPEPTIYYCTEEFELNEFDQNTFKNSDKWTKEKPANEMIRAIAVDFGEGVAEPGTSLKIEIKMRAPTDPKNFKKVAKNKGSISYEKFSEQSDQSVHQNLVSNIVPVTYVPKGKITLTKLDATSGAQVAGAKFELYKKGTDGSEDDKIDTYTVGNNGKLTVSNLEDGTYYFIETEAPKGYVLDSTPTEEKTISEGSTVYITAKNKRQKGKFTMKKVSDRQPDLGLSGAVFSLYKSDGTLERENLTTGTDGKLTLDNLKWGKYYLQEKQAPDGYNISNEKIEFKIDAEHINVTAEKSFVNEQKPAKVKLIKYELKNPYDEVPKQDRGSLENSSLNTSKPLKGAVYELYDESGKFISRKVTNSKGEIYAEDLAFGEYYFKEITAPNGYKLNENEIHFTVGPEDTEVEIRQEIKTADSRKTGSVNLTKTAKDTGDAIHPADKVGGAIYRLYLSTDENFENPLGVIDKGKGLYEYDESNTNKDMVTESTEGFIDITKLPWNNEKDPNEKYVIKEYKAPTGYNISDTKFEFRIDEQTVIKKVILEDEDEQKKGTVKLIKTTDKEPKTPMAGVKFTLYRSDGSIFKDDIETGDDGTVTVDNIPWGSYYFLEKDANGKGGLNHRKFRFVVNQSNAGKTQEIAIEDPAESFQFTVTKKILKKDIVFEHGNPTFIFEAKNTATNQIYRKAVSFSEGDDTLKPDGNGYVTASVIFVVSAGEYEVSEVSVNRYTFKGITANPTDKAGVTIDNVNKNVRFTLNDDTKDIEFIFENEKKDQSGTSDNGLITNTLKANRKLIAISAEYTGSEFLDGIDIPPEDVIVYAYYDDGAQEKLEQNDDGTYPYTIDKANDTMPNMDQAVKVTYENRTDFITVKTSPIDVFEIQKFEGEELEGEVVPPEFDGVVAITGYLGHSSVVNFPATIEKVVDGVKKLYKVKQLGYNKTAINGNFENITIAEGIETIGDNAFSKVNLSGELTIPASVTSIGDSAFNKCNITSLKFAEDSSLTTIKDYAFNRCSQLGGNLTIPAKVKTIGMSVFSNCSSLTSLEFAEDSSLTTIGNSAFQNCSNLSGNLTIPAKVETIAMGAFSGCFSLTSLEFAEDSSLTTIDNGTFENCSGLSGNLTIPASVQTIGNNAFNSAYHGSNASLTFKDGSKLENIGEKAFLSSHFTSLDFGNQGTQDLKISNNAFQDCSKLTDLTIPANVISIGENAFAFCSELTSLKFENDCRLESIESNAFAKCRKLSGTVVLPKNLTSINQNAFDTCSSLENVFIPINAQPGGYMIFNGCSSQTKVYAPTQFNNFSISGSKTQIYYNDYDDLRQKLSGTGLTFPPSWE